MFRPRDHSLILAWSWEQSDIFCGCTDYYLNQENAMAATEVGSKGDNFEVGAYHRLFQTRAVRPGKSYDISPDGQRFLINSAVDTSSSSPVVLVMNWTAGLKKN